MGRNSPPQIGRGLHPFVFEFLLEETERTFDSTLPLDEQALSALRALKAFDAVLYTTYHNMRVAVLSGAEAAASMTADLLVPTHEDPEQPVTPSNINALIVRGCKHWLWDVREDQLLALRRGFSTDEVLTEQPIDLRLQLQTFAPTESLMLLIQGKDEPLSTTDLIERCIKWPDEACAATADNGGGFPPGSTTVALLRALLANESVFDDARRKQFVQWVTGMSVLPPTGLADTDKGRIKIRWDENVHEGAETRWPLPVAATCDHCVTLADFARSDVLEAKLLEGMLHMQFGRD